ncbi:hypothetical protein C2U70_20850 [Bradyrhizobium guangdongense]|uniref:DUF2336 domain-containing protein n=1 Tax=Bradyrhizobium guangdongense TaxID=1325090 RepID=UPI00112E92D0|nr:DUF2336 domain-containing protein [Bradyrhizobium guangdongense]TPQ32824.1 hypothetical protein C2U70_20850 [Bradyrhizobium guangdongense]
MEPKPALVDELESIFASKDVAQRATILRRVTDLFVGGSGRFSDDQIELFDDVMGRLVETIERDARAQFGRNLAGLSDAPPKTIRALALDDAIEVAGPVLQRSERIGDDGLVEVARLKGQDHLLAISNRKVLAETVTDVLVDRGNAAVLSSTARNGGARFSGRGVVNLVEKAQADGGLALSIWSRADIPRQNLIRLFADASEAVRTQMVELDPRRAVLIAAAVAEASDQLQGLTRAATDEFAKAMSYVQSLHVAGELKEAQIHAFANEGSFDKVTAALSLVCDLPIAVVERAFVQTQTDQILVMARAVDLSWVTTVALLLLRAGVSGSSRPELDRCFTSFSKLQTKTAQTALQFYRMREKAAGARSHP